MSDELPHVDEALAILSKLRRQSPDSELVRIEFLEIKAQHEFEKQTEQEKYAFLFDYTPAT